MENRFILDLPADAQRYCSIFRPIVQPGGKEIYSISVPLSTVAGVFGDLGQHLRVSTGGLATFKSIAKPTIVVGVVVGGVVRPMDLTASATFFESTFHDLHWIGLTPDAVVRNVPKKIIVDYYHNEKRCDAISGGHFFNLSGLMMTTRDIEVSLEDLKRKRFEEFQDIGDLEDLD